MARKYLQVGFQKYIFKKFVTPLEIDRLKKHIGSENYYFLKQGQQMALYVKNATGGHLKGNFHPQYRGSSNKYV